MIRKTVKTLLFITAVLTLGQINIGDKTIADRFVSSLAVSVKWTAIKISQSPMLSGVEIPPFMKKWISEKKNLFRGRGFMPMRAKVLACHKVPLLERG